MKLQCGDKTLDLTSPVVMGILNTTPDSFSDGGNLYRDTRLDLDSALRHADSMVNAGAAIIDVGGESTRPGAEPVSLAEELDRVIPVVEQLHARFDVVVSVDTSRAEVIAESAKAGAHFINDVRALQKEQALQAAAQSGLPVCLMHMQGEPDTMQQAPNYSKVVEEVIAFLKQRIAVCEAAGISRQQIVLDPGYGFGKTLEHNLLLVKHLDQLQTLGCPLLIGVSRKSMIGKITGAEVADRLVGSLALTLECVQRGAHIVRVHDVRETVELLKVHCAVEQAE